MSGKKVAGTKANVSKATGTKKAPKGVGKSLKSGAGKATKSAASKAIKTKSNLKGTAKKTAASKPAMKQFSFSNDMFKLVRAKAKAEGITPKAWLENMITSAFGSAKAS